MLLVSEDGSETFDGMIAWALRNSAALETILAESLYYRWQSRL